MGCSQPEPSESRNDGPPLLHASPTREAKGNTRPRPPPRWSTGVIMYTLLAGSPPFWHRKQMLMLRMIMDGKYQFGSPEWDDYSDTVKDLVRGHGCQFPKERKTPQYRKHVSEWRNLQKGPVHCLVSVSMVLIKYLAKGWKSSQCS